MCQVRHTDRFVRMDAAFVQCVERGAYIAQVGPGVVLYRNVSVGHLAHAMRDVDAGVASQHFHDDNWRDGR